MLKELLIIFLSFVGIFAKLNQENFANEALMAHNIYRRIHGVEPLVLNSKLSQMAFSRAQMMAKSNRLQVKQSFLNGVLLGETVGSVTGFTHYTGISASHLWYSSVYKYEEDGELSEEGASFTQLVWKETKEVGFGIAKSANGVYYFVGEYFPSGNIRGQYEENVFELTEEGFVKPVQTCNFSLHENEQHFNSDKSTTTTRMLSTTSTSAPTITVQLSTKASIIIQNVSSDNTEQFNIKINSTSNTNGVSIDLLNSITIDPSNDTFSSTNRTILENTSNKPKINEIDGELTTKSLKKGFSSFNKSKRSYFKGKKVYSLDKNIKNNGKNEEDDNIDRD